jgi:hypothetical protein
MTACLYKARQHIKQAKMQQNKLVKIHPITYYWKKIGAFYFDMN